VKTQNNYENWQLILGQQVKKLYNINEKKHKLLVLIFNLPYMYVHTNVDQKYNE
jgi:hypothetical protein